MSKKVIMLVAASLLSMSVSSFAADNVSERELHYVRGVLERSSTLGKFSQMAIEKSSNEKVKAFAKRTIDEYVAQNKSLAEVAGKLGITGAGIGSGGAGAPPSGGAAASGPPNGAAPRAAAAGAPAGGPPGAQPGGAGGSAAGSGPAGKAQAIVAQLQKASGEEFDNLYLLRAIQYHEDIERNMIGEIMTETANPELLKWSKANIATYIKNAKSAQALVFGEEERGAPPVGATSQPGTRPTGSAPTAK